MVLWHFCALLACEKWLIYLARHAQLACETLQERLRDRVCRWKLRSERLRDSQQNCCASYVAVVWSINLTFSRFACHPWPRDRFPNNEEQSKDLLIGIFSEISFIHGALHLSTLSKWTQGLFTLPCLVSPRGHGWLLTGCPWHCYCHWF